MHASTSIALISSLLLTASAFAGNDAIDASNPTPAFMGFDSAPPNAICQRLQVNKNGRYVAFLSTATNLVPGIGGASQAYRVDRKKQKIECVSFGVPSGDADADVSELTISSNGRYVAYVTAASNLGMPHNGFKQAIWQDLKTGKRRLCSITVDGKSGANDDVQLARISRDGRTVLFSSPANNLIDFAGNGHSQLFAFDIDTNDVERISVSTGGLLCNSEVGAFDLTPFDLSKNGDVVAFQTMATNLDPNSPITTPAPNIFLRDRKAKTTSLITKRLGKTANGFCSLPSVSADGNTIAYASGATNLSASDGNGSLPDLFFFDRKFGVTIRQDVGADGAPGLMLLHPALADDGRTLTCQLYHSPPMPNVPTLEGRRFDRSKAFSEAAKPIQILPETAIPTPNDNIVEITQSGNGKLLFLESTPTGVPSDYWRVVEVVKLQN